MELNPEQHERRAELMRYVVVELQASVGELRSSASLRLSWAGGLPLDELGLQRQLVRPGLTGVHELIGVGGTERVRILRQLPVHDLVRKGRMAGSRRSCLTRGGWGLAGASFGRRCRWSASMVGQPAQYLLSVRVRREDRVEGVLDATVADHQGQS
jgi:hypothetical protein